MSSNSARVKLSSTSPLDCTGSDLDRSADYGGHVGNLWTEIEARMAYGTTAQATFVAAESNDDIIHTLSVACGYIGLVLGCCAVAAGAFLIL